MDKFSELKAAAMAATPGPWGINRTGNTIVSNHSHPVATVSDAFHRQLAGGGVGKDAEFIATANPAAVLELLADNEHLARELVARNGEIEWLRKRAAELEAKDERIGELEAIATEYAGKFQKAQDALKYAAIMSDEDKKKIAELEKRLAKPVRLPTTSGRLGVAYTRVIPEVIEAIRTAGFTVEGDE